jgi:DNA-binding transcriptional LysR family regulator
VDVTIRIADLRDSSLIARRLAPARIALAAAPSYLDQRGSPRAPEDLAHHQCLVYGHTTTLAKWQLSQGDDVISVTINSMLCSNNGDVLRAAALAGHGIVALPTFLIGPDIAAGRLRPVLSDHTPPPLGIFALYAANRYLAVKTRLFIDFLATRFGAVPEWDRHGALP